MRPGLFFLYANTFPSHFEPFFGLQRDTLYVECFRSCSKKTQQVFYRVWEHSATPRAFKPDKTRLLVF